MLTHTIQDSYAAPHNDLLPCMHLQEAENETISAFDGFMGECMASEWAASKRQLFDSSLPERALMHTSATPMISSQDGPTPGPRSHHPDPSKSTQRSKDCTIRHNTGVYSHTGSSHVGLPEDGQAAQLIGREKVYVDVVHALNEASLSGQPFDAVAEFAAAAKQDATG